MPAPQFSLRTIGALPQNAATDPTSFLIVPATIRDFTPTRLPLFPDIEPHPDFEMAPGAQTGEDTRNFEVVKNIVVKDKLEIDPKDGKPKPIYADKTPRHAWTTGAANFSRWFRGIDERTTENVYLILKKEGNNYVLDSDVDDELKKLGGFFAIDGRLLGNYQPFENGKHNFHFTMEAHMRFTYKPGQTFKFTGDDDLWVFIEKSVNGNPTYELIIDLGGVHPRAEQKVNMDTLGLTAGNTYGLHLFYAERHTSESNFRIETSIELLPTVSIQATKPNAHKKGGDGRPVPGEFTISLDRPAPEDMPITFGINEVPSPIAFAAATVPAKEGTDFTLQPGKPTVVIPRGQKSVTIQVNPQGAPPQGVSSSTVVANLKPGAKYQLGSSADVVLISDQLQPSVIAQIVGTAHAFKVGARNGEFKITFNTPVPSDLVVNYQVLAGSAAVAGRDYVPLSGSIFVPKGVTEVSIPIVPLRSQNVSETRSLALQLLKGDKYTPNEAPAGIGIIDQKIEQPVTPPVPTVGITGFGPAYRNSRKDGFFSIVCPDKRPDQSLTVTYQLSGSAAMRRDYLEIPQAGTAVLPPGINEVRIQITPTSVFGSPAPVRVTATLQPAPGTYNIGANPASVDILAGDPAHQGAQRNR